MYDPNSASHCGERRDCREKLFGHHDLNTGEVAGGVPVCRIANLPQTQRTSPLSVFRYPWAVTDNGPRFLRSSPRERRLGGPFPQRPLPPCCLQ